MGMEMKCCPRCRKDMPLSECGVRTNGKPQHWCKKCHCAYQRRYFDGRKEYYANLIAERVERNRTMIRKAKSVPCVDSGQSYPPYVMDFDHRPGEKKCFAVANAMGQTRISAERTLAEIAQCDVVCANRHRIRTHLRRTQSPQEQGELLL